ncbi:MAG: TetR/AcrR family transcriptional regulator [Chloroflexales bacterium]|nr:TetR/AcrR family transcriptional regulator [Chloroflexales bacterium]
MSFAKTFEHNQALFHAALQEFSGAGYEQASINIILKHAGMSKGQFYYHFKNKQDLYFALIEILITRKQAFLAGVMQAEDFNQDIFTIFKTQIRHGIAFAKAHPDIHAFSESFLREKGNTIYEAVMARFNFENDAALSQLIENAYQRGEFQEYMPLSFVKKTIGYLFAHAADLTDLPDDDNAEENLDRLVDFMKTGLARNPSPSAE